MELPFDLAIPLLRLYPRNPKTPIQKNLCTSMFITAQFTVEFHFDLPLLEIISGKSISKPTFFIYKIKALVMIPKFCSKSDIPYLE